MECDIVIRAARPQDKLARGELIEQAITSYDRDAIIFFILQELMLQLSVLCGAVLFIFVGAALHACALVPLALSALAALAVLVAHRAIAHTHKTRLRHEEVGFVAEYRGPLGAARSSLVPRVVQEEEEGAGGVGSAGGGGAARHSRLVGTVSVSEFHGPRRSGWLHGLAVEPQWRRCGVGSALLTAARAHACGARLESLELALSALQHAPRDLLHAHGWTLRHAYHRRLLGDALTLPMLQLGLDLA